MTKKQKLEQVKKALGEDFGRFSDCPFLIKRITSSLSATVAQGNYDQVLDLIGEFRNHENCHVKELAENICEEAKNQLYDGEPYLID